MSDMLGSIAHEGIITYVVQNGTAHQPHLRKIGGFGMDSEFICQLLLENNLAVSYAAASEEPWEQLIGFMELLLGQLHGGQ